MTLVELENVDFFRADGRCMCSMCGAEYYKHPRSLAHPDLNILCSGEYVKL